jgi:Fic family protein
MNKEVKTFLIESNAIEEVYDDVSLNQAIFAWKFLSKQKELTVEAILSAHRHLSERSNLSVLDQGNFRRVGVRVGNMAGLDYTKILEEMNQWVLNVNDIVRNGQHESLVFLERIIKEHHIMFEHIHPFVDFNGRVGRMLMNWERLQVGLPILIIKADWPKEGGEQTEYYKWFK